MSAQLNITENAGVTTITCPGLDDHAIIGRKLTVDGVAIGDKTLWYIKTGETEVPFEMWALSRITLWARGYFYGLAMARKSAEKPEETGETPAATPKVEIRDTRKQ